MGQYKWYLSKTKGQGTESSGTEWGGGGEREKQNRGHTGIRVITKV